jgi:hypothetical protein
MAPTVRWQNEIFIRHVTVTEGWWIDWNCTVDMLKNCLGTFIFMTKRYARKKSSTQGQIFWLSLQTLPTICSKRFSRSRWEIPPSGCLLLHIGIFSLIFWWSIHIIGSILHPDIHLASILRFFRHCWKRQKWWYCILQCNLWWSDRDVQAMTGFNRYNKLINIYW